MRAIYIAARFVRQEEMRQYRDELVRMGFFVTSRWLDGHKIPEGISEAEMNRMRIRLAQEDLEDVARADTVLLFTEAIQHEVKGGRGGRHFEAGYGFAMGKKLTIIGPTENIFYYAANIKRYFDWHDFIEHIKSKLGRYRGL